MILLATLAGGAMASPLVERQTSITCSNPKQTPKCYQLLFPVNVLGRTVDIGVACAPRMQPPKLLFQALFVDGAATFPSGQLV